MCVNCVLDQTAAVALEKNFFLLLFSETEKRALMGTRGKTFQWPYLALKGLSRTAATRATTRTYYVLYQRNTEKNGSFFALGQIFQLIRDGRQQPFKGFACSWDNESHKSRKGFFYCHVSLGLCLFVLPINSLMCLTALSQALIMLLYFSRADQLLAYKVFFPLLTLRIISPGVKTQLAKRKLVQNFLI